MIRSQRRISSHLFSEFRFIGDILGLLLLATTAWAEPNCQQAELSKAALATYDFESPPPSITLSANETVTLTEVRVRQQRVFQEETPWFKRLANRYHWQTRAQVLQEALPFAVGEQITARQLAEAERILRAKPYLFEAAVVVSQRCAGGDGVHVRLDVIARDVWTLNPRLIFSRSGGENEFGIGLSDTNWFGTGTAFSVGYIEDEDRSGVSVFYIDPNLAGSRWSLGSYLFNNDDGHLVDVTLERPFYALDTTYTLGANVRDHKREEGLYFLGDELVEFEAETKSTSLFGGRLLRRTDRSVSRLIAGVNYTEETFEFPTGFPDPATDRNFVYPYIAYQQMADQFVERVNLDRIQRTEDIALGTTLYAELGYAADALGSDGDHWIYKAHGRHTRWLSDTALTSVGFELNGRRDLDNDRNENVVASAYAAFRQNHHERFSFLARGAFHYTDNLTVDRQLLLGGARGLRGYPNRYQTGDRGYLVTLEERYYSDLYPFEMFRLGAAVFVDIGRVWYHDTAPAWVPTNRSGDEFDTLANIGVGLRLESTRTRRDRILHIDFAVPLVDGPNVKGVEITLVAKRSL
ncbi:MAG: ShlB/FhaC/HecB family hemolysin secretion/activation protein [Pseudomonadales bacterium]